VFQFASGFSLQLACLRDDPAVGIDDGTERHLPAVTQHLHRALAWLVNHGLERFQDLGAILLKFLTEQKRGQNQDDDERRKITSNGLQHRRLHFLFFSYLNDGWPGLRYSEAPV